MRLWHTRIDQAGFSQPFPPGSTLVWAILLAGVTWACSGSNLTTSSAGGAGEYTSPDGGSTGGTSSDRTWSAGTGAWGASGGFGAGGGSESTGGTSSTLTDVSTNSGGSPAVGGSPSTGGVGGAGGFETGGANAGGNLGTGGMLIAGSTGGLASGGNSDAAGSSSMPTGGTSTKTPTGGSSSMGGAGTGGSIPFGAGGEHTGTGGANTGGQLNAGGADAGTGGLASFSFFAFGDIHVGQGQAALDNVKTALAQMEKIDPSAKVAFANGDLTDDAKPESWALFDGLFQSSMFHKDVPALADQARLFANLGNHDLGFPSVRSDWLTQWNSHFPAQVELGHNGTDGVYYSLQIENTLFIMLDSQHPSAAQTTWLASLLASEQAQQSPAKIALFHQPVYSCSSTHGPFTDGLAWVDLFERYGVGLVLVSHLHTYDRTCPMLGGKCVNTKGVRYVNLGPFGATNYRSDDKSSWQVSGTDADGSPRTDQYTCSGAGKILDASRSNINDFCRVRVAGCVLTGDCYQVGAANLTPFDTWQFDVCDR